MTNAEELPCQVVGSWHRGVPQLRLMGIEKGRNGHIWLISNEISALIGATPKPVVLFRVLQLPQRPMLDSLSTLFELRIDPLNPRNLKNGNHKQTPDADAIFLPSVGFFGPLHPL